MRISLHFRTIAARLGLLNALFGFGLALLGGLGLAIQWDAMKSQQVEELTALNQVAIAILDNERTVALTAHTDEEDAKRRAYAAINTIHFGKNDYFFILNKAQVTVAHPNPSQRGADFGKVADSNGFHFIAETMPRAVRDGIAVMEYTFPHLGKTEPVTKLAVLTYYPQWELVVGSGLYLDNTFALFWSSALRIIAAAACVLVVISGLGVVMIRSIGRPLRSLQNTMREVAGGRTDVPVPEASLGGEIGAMAQAVLVFRESTAARLRLEAEAAAATAAASAERAELDGIQARAAAQQQAVVASLADGLGSLAAGNLTFRLEQAFAAEYEKLRSDYNAAMEQMQATMTTIVANTAGLRSGAGEMTQAADDLSRRTEQQAASLEQTAAALDEITATVRKTAEGATRARDAVATARTDAEASGDVVREAVAAMSEIEKSAEEISKIIGVIDEIAFQTNLLALNAGVEAARAGDAGRGFAVVASEVRALAQRSADAAKEIKALISTSSKQVGRGVKLVDETGASLTRIVTQVEQISAVVIEIAHSAQEQSTGLHQVNTAINQMDQVTQQNAAMVEESTAASHALATDADELVRITDRFQTSTATIPVERQPRRTARR